MCGNGVLQRPGGLTALYGAAAGSVLPPACKLAAGSLTTPRTPRATTEASALRGQQTESLHNILVFYFFTFCQPADSQVS